MRLILGLAALLAIALTVTLSSGQTHETQAFSFFKTATPTRTPTPTATPPAAHTSPLAPPECASMLFNTVINHPAEDNIFYGTEYADLIILHAGQAYGLGGNDCILFTATDDNGQGYGGNGDDKIITRLVLTGDGGSVGGIADGGAGADQCIGAWEVLLYCP